MHKILCPAYGRKYATYQDMIEDYENGKDFKLLNGPYCSKRDFPNEEVTFMFIKDGVRLYHRYEK